MKGSAKVTEKTSIVRIGAQNAPDVAPMIADPTIGPVHENDTSTSVSAMKKTPGRPPRSALRSLRLTIQPGSVISNAPKNDAAKSMKTMKKIRLGSQCVASQLKMSAVTASPPSRRVSRMIAAMGTV